RYCAGHLTSWKPGRVRSLISDSSGSLWVGSEFSLTGWQPPTEVNAEATPKPLAGSAMSLPGLDFLLASQHGGFWCLCNPRILKFKLGRFDQHGTYQWNPATTPITCACEDQRGNLIVGTAGEGVFWFDDNGDYVQLSSGTISHNWVFCLCMDREGDL